MTTEELRAWLALWRVPGIGPLRFWQLLLRFPNLVEIFKTPQALTSLKLPEKIKPLLKQPDWQGVERDLQWANSENHHIITWFDSRYPSQLKQIHDAPPLLFVDGDPSVLQRSQLAIVGSRRPTPMGLETAMEFAKTLARAGICITSGLALGIDGAAHQGALQAGSPTVAVLACGLDQVYPKQHHTLARQITTQGALVSEFPTSVLPLPAHFPRRNRLVSGLSLGVLVIEASLRSGSLITARLSAEQGREVFAIPGSIRNVQTCGCHLLIQQGAKLVTNCQDILEELPSFCASAKTISPPTPMPVNPPNRLLTKLATLSGFVGEAERIPFGFQGAGKALVGEGEGVYTEYMTEPESHEQHSQNLKGDGYRTAVYTAVHEDSSTASTPKAASEVEFCKQSNTFHPHNMLAESAQLLLECIGYEPTSLDQILDRSGLEIQQAAAQILQLELAGLIAAVDYRYIKL